MLFCGIGSRENRGGFGLGLLDDSTRGMKMINEKKNSMSMMSSGCSSESEGAVLLLAEATFAHGDIYR